MESSDSPRTCTRDAWQNAYSRRPSPPPAEGVLGVSRFSRMECSRMLRVCDSAAWSAGSRFASAFLWPSPSGDEVGTPIKVISELNGWPACAPVNASPATSRPPAHDSGSSWFATPCLYGSFVRDSMPVYPGAPPDPFYLVGQGGKARREGNCPSGNNECGVPSGRRTVVPRCLTGGDYGGHGFARPSVMVRWVRTASSVHTAPAAA